MAGSAEKGASGMEERSFPGPGYHDETPDSYDTRGPGDQHVRAGARRDTGDNPQSGDSLRGFALMISKLLFSLAQL